MKSTAASPLQSSKFAAPPVAYRPAPLWVWNDQLTPRRVRQQLRLIKKAGFGGAFVHPRPGLITEYLGDDWWACFASALDEARRLGIHLQIYDENSYPSGFAGGHVPSQLPHAVGSLVRMREVDRRQPASAGSNVYATAKHKGVRYVFEKASVEPSPWLADFAYPDLLRPEVTRKFLELTHEAYYARFSRHFGRTITAAFYDEPAIPYGTRSLPYSPWLAVRFKRRHGYDLTPEIPKLFLDQKGYERVRFDYYETIHHLFVENWAKPMQAWCRQHRIAITGHYNENNPRHTPNAMAMLEWLDMPGIDSLECLIGLLTTHRGIRRRVLPDRVLDLVLGTVRELQSVANQLGHARTLCEAFGAGGYESTLEDFKRIGDWLYTHGVNYLNPHLTFMTIRGARKRDHPQTFSEHSSWWPHSRPLWDYFARLSYVLSQGRMRQRILLLQPTSSAWLETPAHGASPDGESLTQIHLKTIQFLCNRLWDFDLGDEWILVRHGKVAAKKLQVGQQHYQVIVIPARLLNLRASTLRLLEDWTRQRGRVLILGDPPALVDGRPSQRAARLSRRWERVEGLEQLDRALARLLPKQVEIVPQAGWPEQVALMRRELDPKTICYFFTNMGAQQERFEANFPERGTIEEWDPQTGKVIPLTSEGGATVSVPLDLPRAGSRLLILKVGARVTEKPTSPARILSTRTVPLETLAVERCEENVLALDYCDVVVGGEKLNDMHHWHANQKIAQPHGLDHPAWDSAVQFRRNYLDMKFPKDTGFQAKFHFEVEKLPRSLRVAIESPELYRIQLNSQLLRFHSKSNSWLDPHIRTCDATAFLKKGRNTITLTAQPYDILMELEPVYLLGEFALKPISRGFSITSVRPLALGSWRKQGLPFYQGTVMYTCEFDLARGQSECVLRLSHWAGSLATIEINGRKMGMIAWPQALSAKGGYELDISRGVKGGRNVVRIGVVGTPKNLLGPFHASGKEVGLPHPRGYGWPHMWQQSPAFGQPPGSAYDQIDYGLFADPEIIA